MPVDVKICGVNAPGIVDAAVAGGARFVGFVFFPRSPRFVPPASAAMLAARIPSRVLRVAVVVDADDETLADLLSRVPIDLLQLHGAEPAERVADVRVRFRVPVMKAIAVADPADVDGAAAYVGVADRLLFDARAPAGAARPGGNAQRFDWRLLAGRRWPVPWMLAGGIDAANLADAVRQSGAPAVDVSSGVEDAPGVKSVARVEELLALAAQVGPPVAADAAG